MNLKEDITAPDGPRVLTVSELTGRITDLLEGEIGPQWVEAEVGQVSRPASGHVYLTLVDDRSRRLRCIAASAGAEVLVD